jgi:hypothetical protein
MYQIFDFDLTASPGKVYAANWNYLHTGLQKNLEQVMRYYRRAPMAVASDHFIIRLLQSSTVGKSMPIERYYDNVDGLFSLNLSMALKMTSSLSSGHPFKGTFYGPGCDEILIAHTADFDPFEAEKHWEHLRPVRVLRHPRSDLELLLPDGTKTGAEEGVAVIAINVPMLLVQYRSFWQREQYLSQLYDESPRSINQFVHMYVLPNMLPSHLDYVLFNRINNLAKGAPMGGPLKKHPFYVTDFSQKLNATQSTLLNNLHRVTKSFGETLFNIPAVDQPNMQGVMSVPQMAATRQVVWALGLARFPAIDFLTRTGINSGMAKNGQEINRLRQTIRMYQNSNLFRNLLPAELYSDVELELDGIASRITA